MLKPPQTCPHCLAAGAVKNGFTPGGRQVMRCKSVACRRLFVIATRRPRISQDAQKIAKALAPMLGTLLTADILAQATGLSRRTIYTYKAAHV